MQRRIARTALAILALAAGVAGSSAAHPAKPRVCGSLGMKVDGKPASVVVERGATTCKTAKKVLRAYLRSDAPCSGSACVREHHGFTCVSAKPGDWPDIAGAPRAATGSSGPDPQTDFQRWAVGLDRRPAIARSAATPHVQARLALGSLSGPCPRWLRRPFVGRRGPRLSASWTCSRLVVVIVIAQYPRRTRSASGSQAEDVRLRLLPGRH